MDFRIADTFTDSLARLAGDEQKAVKTTAFDLQLNPANPGMSFHRLDKARDKNFWSVRASGDIRLIVHRTPQSLLLCYAGHHDDAYRWAERRRLEVHPTTGAAQLVELRERVEEIRVSKRIRSSAPGVLAKPLFGVVADDDLLAWGVPREWLEDVRALADEDALLALADHLPAEASEALIEFATGGTPRVMGRATALQQIELVRITGANTVIARTANTGVDAERLRQAFQHPDAQRRFRTVEDIDELRRALDAPWDKWTIFLHPAQRDWVTKDFNGPARVSGSAGTGKTIVALHRAVHLARVHPESRVLLTTFSEPLANALRTQLRRLIGHQPRLAERIDVYAMDAIGQRLYQQSHRKLQLATNKEIDALIAAAAKRQPGHGFSPRFLAAEWRDVVDAWQLDSWEHYRDVQRLGRRTRLPEARRKVLWGIYADVRAALAEGGRTTTAAMFARVGADLAARARPPFDFAVVDEAQDISVAQLRFLAALAGNRPNGLFFAGDLGQRIFQQPFSWKSLGVEVRGRARTLHVNYRTSHQIRMQADRLLGATVADVDGNAEDRRGTVSVFNGPVPEIRVLGAEREEIDAVSTWLQARQEEGVQPHEIALFVRSAAQMPRARAALESARIRYTTLDERVATTVGLASTSTMHLAKGLEFRAVVVMACDDEVIPLEARIELAVDEADLEDVYNTERHLLYVACTRARDRLLVTGVSPASEFLDDLV